jgi:hypothetical protein
MSTKQEIIQTMQATNAKGLVAKRFFHVTAVQHVDSIIERLDNDEVFHCFILLPNSKKQPTEALICTNRRILVWNNEFAEDDEIPIACIKSYQQNTGWFSSNLDLQVEQAQQTKTWTFKCESEIMAAFAACLNKLLPAGTAQN